MNRSTIYKELLDKIGNTPIKKITKIPVPNNNAIYCKYEFLNPSGSHYDRVYLELFKNYELKKMEIVPGKTRIIENTTGCAGISCAYWGKKLGYKTTIIAPDILPEQRKRNIEKLADEFITTKGDYVLGTQRKLRQILIDWNRRYKEGIVAERMFCLNHSMQPESLKAMSSCGEEIINDLEPLNIKIDYFLVAVGNGTTLTGIGELLKKKWDSKIIAIDPYEAQVVNSLVRKGKYSFRLHELYGIGAWGINFPFIKISLIDDVYSVQQKDWEHSLRLLIEKEKVLVGHTSAASLSAALRLAGKLHNKNFLIVFYDSLNNY